MSNSAPVFNKNKVTPTSTAVPQAGGEHRLARAGNDADWSAKRHQEFVHGSAPGQQQTLIKSADDTLTAQEQIVVRSTGNQVSIEAATQITLTVGASTLCMKQDGTIELTGITIKTTGTDITTQCTTMSCQASGQHTIRGGRVDIN
jgi:hypothetical protein